MKYAVKIKNYLKGMYEIAIFDKQRQAEDCFSKLEKLWNKEFESEYELEAAYENVLDEAISYLDYWEARNLSLDTHTSKLNNLKYSVNNNGRVSSEVSNVRFIFGGASVYIPA